MESVEMSIKLKLVLSYIGMIIIPVILIDISTHLIKNVASHLGKQEIHCVLSFGFRANDEKSRKMLQLLTATLKKHPGSYSDPECFRSFEAKQNLASLQMGLIVILNERTIYCSPRLQRQDLLKYFRRQKDDADKLIHIQDKTFSSYQLNFLNPDAVLSSIYLLTDVTSFERLGNRLITMIPVAIIMFIILTGGSLTYFMSRWIVPPLKMLQRATEKIKAGNLDFQIPLHSRDEFGQLAEAFEEMRNRLKESLEIQMQYETNRKELIAGISHDLKTPVTSIKGYVEGILDGVADSPEKFRHYLKTIQTKTNSLDRLIDELLLFSKLDLGKLPFQFEKVHLQKLVRDFYEELQLEVAETSLVLNWEDHSAEPVWVMADRQNLARVLTNLVDNSRKYTANQIEQRIELGIIDSAQEITVWVKDNGRGICSNDLPYIFDSFFRADQARNSDTDGNGLGLAIAKGIVAEHSGQIWAESNRDSGTVISFSLPKFLND
jgi:signal transduction histidine kinase